MPVSFPSRVLCLLLAGSVLTASAAPRTKAPRKAVPVTESTEPATGTGTRCGDEDGKLRLQREVMPQGLDLQLAQTDPRAYLVQVAETAVQRSKQVGVANLLALSAQDDVRDARASGLPTASLTLSSLYAGSTVAGVKQPHGAEGRASLQAGGPLWDWGRQNQLVEWRRQLAESALAAQQNQAEQVALQAVALSLDRSRYTLQLQVYGQYIRKMACLVEALDAITQFDKGRASELIQAQKQQQQAELALIATQDLLKSTETRLRRFVGDPLPPAASLSAVLARLPELGQLQKDLLASPEVAQASAAALAAQHLSESVRASQKPQVGWLSQANTARGNGHHSEVVAGLQVTIPLFRPADAPQRDSVRRRAEAASLQRDETLDAKNWRLTEMYDAAQNSLERARRLAELLRASQQLRGATLQQWQQLGRRSLFDVMGAEADYYSLRVQQVNALYDAQQAVALMGSMGRGVLALLR